MTAAIVYRLNVRLRSQRTKQRLGDYPDSDRAVQALAFIAAARPDLYGPDGTHQLTVEVK